MRRTGSHFKPRARNCAAKSGSTVGVGARWTGAEVARGASDAVEEGLAYAGATAMYTNGGLGMEAGECLGCGSGRGRR